VLQAISLASQGEVPPPSPFAYAASELQASGIQHKTASGLLGSPGVLSSSESNTDSQYAANGGKTGNGIVLRQRLRKGSRQELVTALACVHLPQGDGGRIWWFVSRCDCTRDDMHAHSGRLSATPTAMPR
jgi:hypothetical protein